MLLPVCELPDNVLVSQKYVRLSRKQWSEPLSVLRTLENRQDHIGQVWTRYSIRYIDAED
jgi:hypothetical protein